MRPDSAKFLADIREAGQNILIHGYSLLKHDLVWSVVQQQLPRLIDEVDILLARGSGQS